MGSLKDIGGPAALLNRPLSSVGEISPVSWLERIMLGLTFRGQRIHFGPAQRWLGREWELRLASVNGTIYKVGLEVRAADQSDAVEISIAVDSVLRERLGAPTPESKHIFFWDGDDGNAVLQLANVGDDRRVMVFLTSRIVRDLRRR